MATITWKINDVSFESLGLKNPVLELVNRAVDRLTFEHATAFDGTAAFAVGDSVVLKRQVDSDTPVVVFRGKVRDIPRLGTRAGERITYTANGAWEQLERRAFLQTFKEPSDPGDPDSTLVDVPRGQVILGQNTLGVKISVETSITAIIEYAAACGAAVAVGDIDLNESLIWRQVNDRSCAEAINFLLRNFPDVVGWWDYAPNPPEFHLARRSVLDAVSLAVQPVGAADDPGTYAPLEEVRIRPRYDLLVDHVVLLFLQTNRTNDVIWQYRTPQVYPPGTDGTEDNALVRTLELAGSSFDMTILEQKVTTDAFPSELIITGDTIETSGATFDALSDWWKAHFPALTKSNVTIRAFSKGNRLTAAGGAINAACDRELLTGAITDWMIDNQSVEVEDQIVSVKCEILIADPFTNNPQVISPVLHARVKATSADRTLYSFLSGLSITAGEEIPTGMAQALYNSLSVLQYDGSLQLTERDISFLVTVGKVLNLTGSLTAWATMKALVQSVRYDLTNGRSEVTVGPPGQLGPDDLVNIYRENRNSPPVTIALTRTTGRIGGSGSVTSQSLSKHHPEAPGTPATFEDFQVFNQ